MPHSNYIRVLWILHGARKAARQFYSQVALDHNDIFTHEVVITTVDNQWESQLNGIQIKFDRIVVCGGDGLWSKCIQLAMRDQWRVPISLVPCGSGNDYARNWRQLRDWKSLRQRLIDPKVIMADVIAIQKENYLSYAINECSFGLSTQVVELVQCMPSERSGNLKFGLAILKAFSSYRAQKIEWMHAGERISQSMFLMVVAKGGSFGSGIIIAPHARMDSGRLHLTLIGNVSVWDYLRFLPKLKKGIPIQHPEVHYITTDEISILNAAQWEADGELGKRGPCTIKVLPQAVCINNGTPRMR